MVVGRKRKSGPGCLGANKPSFMGFILPYVMWVGVMKFMLIKHEMWH